MAHDSTGDETPTRRACLRYGGAVVGGLFAGCTGGDGESEADVISEVS